jgi:ABC-type cobalamin/Fe3+-siderophores transport system ATPase subunit
MITKIAIKNFKKFSEAEVELGDRVVFIGPNNAGKTTCLQALALWSSGLVSWLGKKSGKNISKRTGVAINRKDLIHIPLPESKLLWKNKHVKNSEYIDGKQTNENVKIEIVVEGVDFGRPWKQGLEFDYANSESIYCRPIGNFDLTEDIVEVLLKTQIAFLQPMSGLAPIEPKLEMGRINVLLGEGQTAQVLRNLSYHIYSNLPQKWEELNNHIEKLFGARLNNPEYIVSRGEITLTFSDRSGVELDLISAGRGFQQTLLLLSYLFSNPNSVLLLDEPDAHLEILRQQQIYQVLSDISRQQQSQIIIASHSEVLLNEAADRDIVVAFVGKPHRIDDRSAKSQVLKSLKEIGFDQYYLAEQTGWVLYLEGSTDLAILRKLAEKLNHEAKSFLERPFIHYVLNQPALAEKHFFSLREAKESLVGIAIYDRLKSNPNSLDFFIQATWKKRELENYFIDKNVLIRYARFGFTNDLFGTQEANRRERIMNDSIDKITEALKILRQPLPWTDEIKITDDFLDKVFESYFEELQMPNLLRKTDYHSLIDFFDITNIDSEVVEKLDLIVSIAKQAKPETE